MPGVRAVAVLLVGSLVATPLLADVVESGEDESAVCTAPIEASMEDVPAVEDRRVDLLDHRLGLDDALLFERVRGEPAVDCRGPAGALREQHTEHRGNPLWIDTGAGYEGHPVSIGLALVIAAELREHGRARHVDQRACRLILANSGENAGELHANLRLLHLLHLLHRVALDDVPDFVPEHARHHRQILRSLDEPAIHVDEAARHRERVDVAAVHDVEAPIEIPLVGQLGDRIAQHVDVAIDLRIGDDRKLSVDLLRVTLPKLNFLLRRDAARDEHRHGTDDQDVSFHWFGSPMWPRSVAMAGQIPFHAGILSR